MHTRRQGDPSMRCTPAAVASRPLRERSSRSRRDIWRAWAHRQLQPERGPSCAKYIVSISDTVGISTIHLAAALRDNGRGRLIGSELESDKVERARANLRAAELKDLADIREGDALQTLARDLPDTIDLVLLDEHKPLYLAILDLVAPRLRSGALLVADNVHACPDYVARVRAVGGPYLSVPFAEDIEISIKL